VVHILDPIQESTRLAQVLERLGAQPVAGGCVETPRRTRRRQRGSPADRPRERGAAVGRRRAANKQIAQELDLPATVRNHIHNILEKLGVHSKLEAVSLAFRAGWVLRQLPTGTAAPAGGARA
jgi:DNA-binding CsgD family transcriptional regulator